MTTFATPEGTRRYAARFPKAAEGHFRDAQRLAVSSLGIGTYLGNPDEKTDRGYTAAIVEAAKNGINVMDAAINYRFQRSERSIGAAVTELSAAGIARDELVLCTKAGYLTPDGEMPRDPNEYFFREYIQPGVLSAKDIVGGGHCMTPRFLKNQLGRSLRNMRVDCVDVFYLHNPETQLSEVPKADFLERIRRGVHISGVRGGGGRNSILRRGDLECVSAGTAGARFDAARGIGADRAGNCGRTAPIQVCAAAI